MNISNLLLALGFFSFSVMAFAQYPTAPNGPGMKGIWDRPDKQAFLATEKQNLWATVADGILTEVYYPTIDRAQTRDTQILILIGNVLLEERKDFTSVVHRFPHTLAYHVTSVNQAFQVKIEKDIILDPARPVIVENYAISFLGPTQGKIYVLHNPAADNTAGGDAAFVKTSLTAPGEILAYQSDRRGDEPVALARRTFQYLVLDRPATVGSAGFEGVNDPWTQLHAAKEMPSQFSSAINGNVAAALGFEFKGQNLNFHFALAFAEENQDTLGTLRQLAAATMSSTPGNLVTSQQNQWNSYLGSLNSIGQRLESHVLMIRGLEDKIYPGAIVAGPSLPELPDHLEAQEDNYEEARLRKSDANGGYHRVWPRDAFQMALGLLAAGDTATPTRVLRMYARIQAPSGIFPQNTWTDGQISWNGFQLDQTGFPILLASRLVEVGAVNYDEFRMMVVNAADALVRLGPWTNQDRWEEARGLSPNTIAVACQALDEAAYLESRADPSRSQVYSSTCQKWRDSILRWTFIANGPLGQNYFERMEVADDFSHTATITIANEPAGGSRFVESEIIDGGFIQWIISGLVSGTDPHFSSSLAVYDRTARAPAYGGMGYLRYNHDGYGTNHVGKAWALLSGERALAALVRGEDPTEHLNVLGRSVTSAGLVCEQTDLSACPLGWAQAEMLIVARSMADHKSFYIPKRVPNYFNTSLNSKKY
jgi:glucoamylase